MGDGNRAISDIGEEIYILTKYKMRLSGRSEKNNAFIGRLNNRLILVGSSLYLDDLNFVTTFVR